MPYTYRSSNSNYSKKRNNSRSWSKPSNRSYNSERIDPKRFIAVATNAQAEPYVSKNTFVDFELDLLLQANLSRKGYITPSPIQDQSIPAGLAGKDIIGMAGTGTGKTGAFSLPVLQKLITNSNSAALVIAPTRELAQQIEEECRILSKGSRVRSVLLIGGSSMGYQLRELRYNPHLVIGTPGRIKDHLKRGTLKLNQFNLVVLDEVDRMLDMGFVADIREILSQTNSTRQCFFFSATIDNKVRNLIDSFTSDPVTISIKTSSASENIHQDVVRYQGQSDKIDQLHDLLLKNEVSKAIVFDETQRSVERLHKELSDRGFTTEAIHGGKTQGQRQRAMAKFKQNEVNILVATDVAARGIDVTDITHVINYSVPKMYDDYIHRIGRAGRAGRIGHALTFIAK